MNFHSAEFLKAFEGKRRENVLSRTVNIGLKIADAFIKNFNRRMLQFPGQDFQKKGKKCRGTITIKWLLTCNCLNMEWKKGEDVKSYTWEKDQKF